MTEAELHRLLHLNFQAFSRETARWSGRAGEIVERDGLLLMASGSTFPVEFNALWRLDPTVPAADAIAAADAWFGAKGRVYGAHVRPDDPEDQDLAAALEAAGFLGLEPHPEMVCRARIDPEVVPDDVELRWVTDAAGMADVVAINDEAYQTLGMPAGPAVDAITDAARYTDPHIHTVVAHLDGRPVATAQTVLSHGIAGVYWVGTRAEARGRGLGEVVTRAVTNRAFDLGAAVVGLQASSMGQPIYARIGYEIAYDYRTFLRLTPAT